MIPGVIAMIPGRIVVESAGEHRPPISVVVSAGIVVVRPRIIAVESAGEHRPPISVVVRPRIIAVIRGAIAVIPGVIAVIPEVIVLPPVLLPCAAMTTDTTEAARRGDPAALEALLRERRAQVVRYAMRLCISPADAEDATQETLLALSRYVGALREAAALSSWLFAAVRTHCTRLARRSLRHALAQDDGEPLALEGPSPEDQLVDRQLRRRLAVVLGELDPDLREALVRRDVLGEDARTAALALGISVPALKSRLHRARAEAKERLLASLAESSRRRTILGTLRPG